MNFNCHKTLSTGVVIQFCCDNHEEKDGRCIECQSGYKSIDGKPCQPCPNGWWGQKCKYRCQCSEHQSCHHKWGCSELLGSTGNIVRLSSESTQYYLNEHDSTWKFQEQTTENNNMGGVKSDIVLYTMPLGLALTIICGFICVFLRWKNSNKYVTCVSRREQLPVHVQHSRLQQQESFYDLIDEEAMDIENIQLENKNGMDLDSTSSSIQLRLEPDESLEEKNVFQNAYQPLNGDQEQSYYKTIKLDPSFMPKPAIKEDVSKGDDEEGYLKPVHEVNVAAMTDENQVDNVAMNSDRVTLSLDMIALEGSVQIRSQPVVMLSSEQATNTPIYLELIE